MKLRNVLFMVFVLMSFMGSAQNVAPKTHVVEIKNMEFVPAEVVVQKGDTVVWINKGIVPHNVTEQETAAWASPLLKPGDSWKMTVLESADYYCTLHSVMKAKLRMADKNKHP